MPVDASFFGAGPAALTPDSAPAINAAIQAALRQSQSAHNQAPEVYLPAGNYYIGSPLVLPDNNVRLRGDGRGNTIVNAVGYMGPHILAMGSGEPALPTRSLPGLGTAMALDHAKRYCLNFQENPNLSLNGLSQFHFSCFVIIDSFASDYSLVFHGGHPPVAGGGPAPNGGINTTLQVYLYNGGTGGSAQLNIGGTLVSVPTGAWTSGVVHHFEMDYDGAHLYSFLDGSLIGSAAASGTVVSTIYEDFVIGPAPAYWPNQGALTNMPSGAIAGVRISNVARHTAAFTPPTALPIHDGADLFVCNFDKVTTSPCLVGYYTQWAPNSWVPLLSRDAAGTLTNVHVRDIGFGGTGTGIRGVGALDSQFENLFFNGTWGGVYLDDTSYGATIKGCKAVGAVSPGWGAKFGFFTGGGSGISRIRDCKVTGFAFPMGSLGGTRFENPYLEPTGNSRYGIMAFSSGDTFCDAHVDNAIWDMENLVPNWQALAYFGGLTSVRLMGGQPMAIGTGGGKPALALGSVGSGVAVGSVWEGDGSTPLLNFLNTAGGKFNVLPPYQIGAATPWANDLSRINLLGS